MVRIGVGDRGGMWLHLVLLPGQRKERPPSGCLAAGELRGSGDQRGGRAEQSERS